MRPTPPPPRPRRRLELDTEPPRRESVRTLFTVRARVTLVWALISLALGFGAYILVRAVAD